MDVDVLEPGVDIEKKIMGVIKDSSNAGAFIVLLSENSIHREHIWRELSYAESLNSLIIPIVVGDIELPLTLEARILDKYKKITIEKLNFDSDYGRLFRIQDILIDDENFKNCMEYIADEIWNALKGKFK